MFAKLQSLSNILKTLFQNKMPKREFAFSNFKQRHIALKFTYLGWNYCGLAHQKMEDNTVEGHIIRALIKTCLVESFESCQLTRAGRTDKEVSSYGQVIDLNVRSRLTDETNANNIGLFTPENYSAVQEVKAKIRPGVSIEPTELNYVELLNRVLPQDIRILAWSPVARNFSSRFLCKQRTYSYIFPIGNLCLDSMAEGLSYLVGQHDFRNLCTIDLSNNVLDYNRIIYSVNIEAIESPSNKSAILSISPEYCYYRIKIVGRAFLYHQIRHIMTIIFLIGTKLEKPTLIKDLLDVEKCPAKPQFNYTSGLPLSLVNCDFNEEDLPLGWIYDTNVMLDLRKHYKQMWLEHKTKTSMIEDVLFIVESKISRKQNDVSLSSDVYQTSWQDFGLKCDNRKLKNYVPILNRPKNYTLEEKIKLYAEKNKDKLLKQKDVSSVDDK